MALVEGAKILRKHLNPFIQYAEPGPEMPIDDSCDEAAQPRHDRSIRNWNAS